MEKLPCASGKVIHIGDFNINFMDTSGFAYKRFVDILETFDFVQHIDKPTHNSGHLLDYIITSKRIYVVDRHMNDWMTDDILVLKALRRKYESLWRKTRVTVHFDIYSYTCNCTHSTAHFKSMFDYGGFSYFL